MSVRSVVVGCGACLPDKILTNDDVARIVETSDSWIRERSGIEQRHIAAAGETTSDLAATAARAAIADAGLCASDIDLVVLATSTSDEVFPAAATVVQAKLGMTHGAAFDVQAVCCGFIYALSIADAMLRVGQVRRALVVGADIMSRLLDWSDRTTCVLFGDGAGALVLAAEEGEDDDSRRGLLSSHLHADGRDHDSLYIDGGPSSTGTIGRVRMKGRDVFRKAIERLTACSREALDAHGLTADDIDWVAPHQANLRIMRAVVTKLGVNEERMISTIAHHANTSAASIPLALAAYKRRGLLRAHQLLLLNAIGGGLTWGSCLLRW